MSAEKRVKDPWLDFHPDRDPKYSHNFYAFLSSRRHRLFAAYSTGYRHEDGTVWFGHVDPNDDAWFTGCQLARILSLGARAEVFSYVGVAKRLTPIPLFWELYRGNGRCVVDPDHKISFIGDEHNRWDRHDDTRTCRFCGATQHLTRHVEVREIWVLDSPTVSGGSSAPAALAT